MKRRYLTFPIVGILVGGAIYLGARWGWNVIEPEQVESSEIALEPEAQRPDVRESLSEANSSIRPAIIRSVDDEVNGLIIRGTSEKSAKVSVLDNGRLLAQIPADKDGIWQSRLNVSAPRNLALSLSSQDAAQNSVPGDELLLVVDQEDSDQSLILLTATGGPSRIFKTPFGTLPRQEELTLGPIDYDDRGSVIFSGFSTAEGSVRVYNGESVIGETGVTLDGRWFLIAGEAFGKGPQEFRFELRRQDSEPSVLDVTVERMSGDIPDENIHIIRDEMNWHIRRKLVGGGHQYTAILSPQILLPKSDEQDVSDQGNEP